MNSINCKKFQLFTLILLLCTSFSRQQTTPSSAYFGQQITRCDLTIVGDCIVYNMTEMTWDVAEQNCIQLGGHLTSILSGEENSLISANRPNSTITGYIDKEYFIGCNDKVDCRNFTWSDGTPFGYTNWGSGEPNSNNEHCCEMIDTGKWNDIGCNEAKKMSICKISAKVQCIGSDRFLLNKTCIIYNDNEMNWKASEQYCMELGGHLASIHSKEEDTAIRMNATESDDEYYIGYNDMADEGDPSWSDNTQIDYIATIPTMGSGINNIVRDCCVLSSDNVNWRFRRCRDQDKEKSICRISAKTITPTSITPSTTSTTTTPPTTSSNTQPTTNTTTQTTSTTTTQPTSTTTTQPTTSNTTQLTTSTTTQPTSTTTTQPTTSTTTQLTTSTTTQLTTSTTTQPTTSTTTQLTTSTTTQPTTSTTTQPTTSTTTQPTTSTPTLPTTSTPTQTSTSTTIQPTTSTPTQPTTSTTTQPTTSTTIQTATSTVQGFHNMLQDRIEDAKNDVKSFLNLSSLASNAINIITEEFARNIIESVDTIFDNLETTLTAEIDSDREIAIRALNVLSEHSDLIFMNTSNNESYTNEFGSVFFEIHPYNPDVPSNSTITFPFTAVNRINTVTIAIPQAVFPQIHKNSSRILVTTHILKVNISMGNNNQVATSIFSINIPGIQPGQVLPKPVRITFPTNRNISNPLCSFIDFTSSPPIFNQSGLILANNSPDFIICESIHLTNFAVLAGSMTQPSTDIEILALSITSYLLLSLSLLFMIASIVAYLVSYKTVFNAEINILYFNFSIALTIAILAFFISNVIDKTIMIEILCGIMAFLVHYTWINVFTSGTACSISITYAIIITLLRGNRKKIYPYLIVASWGLPLLVTVTTVAIGVFHYHAYSTSNGICMLSSKNNMIVAFYAPILLLILLNIILLVVILFLLWKAYRIQDKNVSELLLFKKLITSTLILLPILGLPFLLVPIIAHVNISNSAIDWIFIFLYCPIGIAFFLLVTLRNSDISHHFSKLCRKATSEDLEANVAQRGDDKELKVYQNFFAFLMIASEKHVKQSNM